MSQKKLKSLKSKKKIKKNQNKIHYQKPDLKEKLAKKIWTVKRNKQNQKLNWFFKKINIKLLQKFKLPMKISQLKTNLLNKNQKTTKMEKKLKKENLQRREKLK